MGGGPGPAEAKGWAEFVGDSVFLANPRGDSMVTTRLAVPKGTLPYFLHIYGLVEQIGRWARAMGRDSVALSAVTSSSQTSGGHVKKRPGRTPLFHLPERQLAGLGAL